MIKLDRATAEKIIKFYEEGFYRHNAGPTKRKETGAHVVHGYCPTVLGDTSRDPDCPACQVLVTVEKALANENDALTDPTDDFDKILEGNW